MANEAYYKCPHCMGKVMIVLKENGRAWTEKDD